MNANHSAMTNALIQLAEVLDPDVATLPIHFFNTLKKRKDPKTGQMVYTSPPAFTTSHGIYIHKDVSPDSLPILITHEVGHHIFADSSVRTKYTGSTCNEAEDFKINQWANEEFGYCIHDVIHGGVKWTHFGLLDPKYDKMSVAQVAEDLAKHRCSLQGCGFTGVSHPLILRIAQRLRNKYGKKWGIDHQEYFHCDVVDEKTFFDRLKLVQKQVKLHGIDANADQVLKGLWSHLFLHDAVSTKVTTPFFSNGQSLAYIYPGKKYRAKTVGRPDESLLASAVFLKGVSEDPEFIAYKRAYYNEKTMKLIEAIDRKKSRDKKPFRYKEFPVPVLRKMIKEAETELEKWEKTVSIQDLMKDSFIKTLPTRVTPAPSMTLRSKINDQDFYPGSVVLPRYEPDAISKRLRIIANRKRASFEKVKEMMEYIENHFPLRDDPSDPEPCENIDPDDDSPNVEGDGVEGKGRGRPVKGSGSGKGEGGGNSRVEVMFTLLKNQDQIDRILTAMKEMQTLLTKNKLRRTSDDATDPTYAFGNEIPKIAQSEYALLGNKATRLDFLRKFANSSLLLLDTVTTKRFPVALNLDGSGSMSGRRFEIAAGFVLAMVFLLHDDNRGVVVNTFSSQVTTTNVIEPGKPVDFNKLITDIVSPDMGGTDFDKPILSSYETKEKQNWKNMLTLLVSDGEGGFAHTEEIKEKKVVGDRIVGVLTQDNPSLREVLDNVWVASKENQKLRLVEAGTSLL